MNIRNVPCAHRKHRLYGFPQIYALILRSYLSNDQKDKYLCYSAQSVFSVCETLIGHFADSLKKIEQTREIHTTNVDNRIKTLFTPYSKKQNNLSSKEQPHKSNLITLLKNALNKVIRLVVCCNLLLLRLFFGKIRFLN